MVLRTSQRERERDLIKATLSLVLKGSPSRSNFQHRGQLHSPIDHYQESSCTGSQCALTPHWLAPCITWPPALSAGGSPHPPHSPPPPTPQAPFTHTLCFSPSLPFFACMYMCVESADWTQAIHVQSTRRLVSDGRQSEETTLQSCSFKLNGHSSRYNVDVCLHHSHALSKSWSIWGRLYFPLIYLMSFPLHCFPPTVI